MCLSRTRCKQMLFSLSAVTVLLCACANGLRRSESEGACLKPSHRPLSHTVGVPEAHSTRLDLDDVNGEILLLHWGGCALSDKDVCIMRYGAEDLSLYARSFIEG